MSVPSNWIFSTNTFSRSWSDPRGEGVSVFSPTQDTYSTKHRQVTPIRITCDSNAVSFILQKLVMSMDVTALKNGLESIIQSLTIKAGGETVTKIDNYPAYLVQTYRSMSKGHKYLLGNMTGYGSTNVFSTTPTASFSMHPYVGFLHPNKDLFFPVWALPNQSLTFEIVLADPNMVFTSAGVVDELQVTNIRVQTPFVTPPPRIVINATRAVANGKSLFYDYVRTNQVEQNCSCGSKNTFVLHMSGVRSLASLEMSFIDEDQYSDQTKDKSEVWSSQNLREWRIQLGTNATIPSGVQGFTHSPYDKQTLLVSHLSNNDFSQLADMDISFADYDDKQFSFAYGFQDKSEGSSAALSFHRQ
ncbi:hypothetical protein DFS34DRAFT_594306 [Phlyctochytrium arcticum]|nr:hypothetical protein DFS34DRAFT_594306 [Phlyctochytrium arcticum]